MKGYRLNATLLAVAVSVALAGCATGPQAASFELLHKVEIARTQADHEELASYYEKAAKDARATAEVRRKLAKSYQSSQAAGRGGAGITARSNALATQYERAAETRSRSESAQDRRRSLWPLNPNSSVSSLKKRAIS